MRGGREVLAAFSNCSFFLFYSSLFFSRCCAASGWLAGCVCCVRLCGSVVEWLSDSSGFPFLQDNKRQHTAGRDKQDPAPWGKLLHGLPTYAGDCIHSYKKEDEETGGGCIWLTGRLKHSSSARERARAGECEQPTTNEFARTSETDQLTVRTEVHYWLAAAS